MKYKTIGISGPSHAKINQEQCSQCDLCRTNCQFHAITSEFYVDDSLCTGCKTCMLVCPNNALSMKQGESGLIYESNTRFGPMVHAEIDPINTVSKSLIVRLREHARDVAEKKHKSLIFIDGGLGVGETVIETIRDVALVVLVTEPTYAGIHDFKRVVQLTRYLNVPAAVLINKSSIDERKNHVISSFCSSQNIPVLGSIPYSSKCIDALMNEKTILEYDHGIISDKIKTIWGRLRYFLSQDEAKISYSKNRISTYSNGVD